jgi:hypothetical protein
MAENWLTCGRAGRLVGVGAATVRAAHRAGELPSELLIDGAPAFRSDTVVRWAVGRLSVRWNSKSADALECLGLDLTCAEQDHAAKRGR